MGRSGCRGPETPILTQAVAKAAAGCPFAPHLRLRSRYGRKYMGLGILYFRSAWPPLRSLNWSPKLPRIR